MAYQNGQVESALARVCRIPAAELGAFKGKLRHLRNLGIPKVRRVGSGNRAKFNRSDVLTMRLALEFSTLGIKPAAVAGLTTKGLEHLEEHSKTVVGKDVYLIVFPAHPQGYIWLTAYGIEGVAKIAEKISATNFVTINLSRLVREMDMALEE